MGMEGKFLDPRSEIEDLRDGAGGGLATTLAELRLAQPPLAHWRAVFDLRAYLG